MFAKEIIRRSILAHIGTCARGGQRRPTYQSHNARQLIAMRNFSSTPFAEVPALPADHPNANLCFNGLEPRNPGLGR